jgi:hypothetical protein
MSLWGQSRCCSHATDHRAGRPNLSHQVVRVDMRENRSTMCDLALAPGLRIFRLQQRAFHPILIGSSILLTAGCATIAPRNALSQAAAGQIELQGFDNIRFWGDASARDIRAIMMADATSAEMRSASGVEKHQPVSNLLAISGGAEDGAFGAGLLVGWSDAGTRPVFDMVTGVSSGALAAPFVYLGREHDSQPP